MSIEHVPNRYQALEERNTWLQLGQCAPSELRTLLVSTSYKYWAALRPRSNKSIRKRSLINL